MMFEKPTSKIRSYWSLLYWYLAPSTAKVRTRITEGDSSFSKSAAYIMKRIWWAFADPKYQVAFVIPTNHLIAAFFSNSERMQEIPNEIKGALTAMFEYMGDRGEDWDVIDFGDPFFHALVTKSDDWLVMARLSGSNMAVIRMLFNNYIEYRPGSELWENNKKKVTQE